MAKPPSNAATATTVPATLPTVPTSGQGRPSSSTTNWAGLPNGDKFGIRHSSRHGETLDFNVKGLPRDFKIHQK